MRCASRLALVVFLGAPGIASQQQPASEIERAVEEFRIQTRNLGLRADSPRRAARPKAPWRDWHGRLFWNLRNDTFDAVPHEVTQTGGTQGILRRNQYGFNVSGPVFIPGVFDGGKKTFFSLSYEGMREKIGRSYLETIPIIPERAGDFSQTVDKAGEPLPVFDPAGTRPNPGFNPSLPVSVENLEYVRDPFPGNVIPQDRLDPAAREATRYLPDPNVSIGPFFQNNYTSYFPEVNKADGMRGKLDHAVGERHRLAVSFSWSNGFDGPAKFYDNAANPGRPDREFRSRSLDAEHTYTVSPTSVNTFRVSGWISRSENLSDGQEGEDQDAFPYLRFPPYLSMGRSYPVSLTARTAFQVSDGLSARFGKHSLRFGFEWEQSQANSFWPQYPSGRFDFSEGLTSLPGIVNTGHPFASFLLGLSRFAEASIVDHPSYFRSSRGGFDFRDEWEIRTGLNLTFGLGWDFDLPRVEKYDRSSTVDLEAINPANGLPGALVFAGRNGVGRVFQPNRYNVEPWLSVSWSPFGRRNTVVRATVRRYYTSLPLYSGQWGTQGFNGTPTLISANEQLESAAILRDGLPALPAPLPDLRPEAANDTVADLVDPSDRLPRFDYVRVSVERQLPGALILNVGAQHTTGRDMQVDDSGANPNAIPLDDLAFRDQLNDEEFNRSLRPFPQYRRFRLYSQFLAGRYQRTEGYLQLVKRTSQGLSLRMAYEFSKQMDDYSGDGLQDYYHREKEWSMNPFADPHTLSLTYMYELPFGPSKRYFNAGRWQRYLVGGWSISGVTTYSSGDPIRLRAQFNNTGRVVDTLYVNAVPGVDPEVSRPGPERWFNPGAFINPPDFSIGAVSRAHPTLRNPIRQNHDLAVTKRVSLASDRAIELLGTALNFLNHANWNRPDAVIGTADAPNLNAGRIIGSRGGRVIQLGLRLTF